MMLCIYWVNKHGNADEFLAQSKLVHFLLVSLESLVYLFLDSKHGTLPVSSF